MDTEVGKIANAVQSIEFKRHHLRLKYLAYCQAAQSDHGSPVAGFVSILTFTRGHGILDTLVWGISLAVAAVPEALPAVITASLAVATYRMAKQNAIVKNGYRQWKILGSTTVIQHDKTGTLTTGEMTVRKIYVYDKFADVTGAGYSLEGNVEDPNIEGKHLVLLAKSARLCNDASIEMMTIR